MSDRKLRSLLVKRVYPGMRGPGGPAGLQNRFAAVIRPWRFDSPAFRDFRATGYSCQASDRVHARLFPGRRNVIARVMVVVEASRSPLPPGTCSL